MFTFVEMIYFFIFRWMNNSREYAIAKLFHFVFISVSIWTKKTNLFDESLASIRPIPSLRCPTDSYAIFSRNKSKCFQIGLNQSQLSWWSFKMSFAKSVILAFILVLLMQFGQSNGYSKLEFPFLKTFWVIFLNFFSLVPALHESFEDSRESTSRTTGPVFTVVKTDSNANVKWGVRHYVGRKYHWEIGVYQVDVIEEKNCENEILKNSAFYKLKIKSFSPASRPFTKSISFFMLQFRWSSRVLFSLWYQMKTTSDCCQSNQCAYLIIEKNVF